MEDILNLIAIVMLILMTYYVTIYYDRKTLNKCSTKYKLRE
jgi:hypothetical protein